MLKYDFFEKGFNYINSVNEVLGKGITVDSYEVTVSKPHNTVTIIAFCGDELPYFIDGKDNVLCFLKDVHKSDKTDEELEALVGFGKVGEYKIVKYDVHKKLFTYKYINLRGEEVNG